MKTSAQLEHEIRKIRQTIFDLPENDQDAATEQIGFLKTQLRKALVKEESPAPKGPYSGLTKRELAQSGTCETDWF
jgi:hypothetical protein